MSTSFNIHQVKSVFVTKKSYDSTECAHPFDVIEFNVGVKDGDSHTISFYCEFGKAPQFVFGEGFHSDEPTEVDQIELLVAAEGDIDPWGPRAS